MPPPIKALTILMLTSALALAEPPPSEPASTQEAPTSEQALNAKAPVNADALRKRLRHTLEFAKRIVEKHEEALAQLDAGDDPRQVMRALRTPELRQVMRDTNRIKASSSETNTRQSNHQVPEFSKRELKQVRAFIAEHLKEVEVQLAVVEKMTPEAIDRLLGRLAPKIIEILQLKESNPVMAELKLDELKAGLHYVEASRQYRGLLRNGSNDQAALNQAEQRVRDTASARFDAQVQIKQFEIHQLTQRISQLHLALEELNAQRDEQVNAQVNAAKRTPGPRFNRPAQGRPHLHNNKNKDD